MNCLSQVEAKGAFEKSKHLFYILNYLFKGTRLKSNEILVRVLRYNMF